MTYDNTEQDEQPIWCDIDLETIPPTRCGSRSRSSGPHRQLGAGQHARARAPRRAPRHQSCRSGSTELASQPGSSSITGVHCRPPPPSPTPTCRDARPTPTRAPPPAAAPATPPPPAGQEPHPRPLRRLPTEPGRRPPGRAASATSHDGATGPPGSHRQPARFRLAVRLRGDRLDTQPLHVPQPHNVSSRSSTTASHKSPPSSLTPPSHRLGGLPVVEFDVMQLRDPELRGTG